MSIRSSAVRLLGMAGVAFIILALISPVAALAQTGEVSATTAYPGVIVDAGKTANFTLTLTGDPGTVAKLGVEGLPDGWTSRFKGGGAVVSEATVAADTATPTSVTLEVTVPGDAEARAYELTATVGPSRLPLSVTVQPGVGGSVVLTPDFLGLRGPNDADFAFNVTVENQSDATVNLELSGTGPSGWTVTAEPTSQSKAAVISVDAGQSTTVKLTAKAPADAEAGTYDVGMSVSGSGIDESITVQVELVGQVSMSLTTPDQRLNAEISAGGPSDIPLLIFNDGTAELTNITIAASAPTDWEVTFSPASVPSLAPGDSTVVTAQVTTAEGAIAGDYDITFNGRADAASDSVDIRTTVTPSALGGLVGAGLIALTLAGLSLVFRQFGRR